MFFSEFKFLFIALVFSWLINIFMLLDLNKRVYNHTPKGGCFHISGIVNGSEDMQLMPDGNVLISGGLIYANPQDAYDNHGKVFIVNVKDVEKLRGKKESIKAKEVPIRVIKGGKLDLKRFNPHGMSSWENKVYIVNHGDFTSGDAIEVFHYNSNPPSLTHHRSIRHDLIVSLNDVVAVAEDVLFASNDHYFKEPTMKEIETFSTLPLGNLIKIEGLTVEVAENFLNSPNGLAFDVKSNHLYLSLIGQRSVRIYRVSKSHGTTSLTKSFDMPLGSMCDNLYAAPNGDLWTACHPIGYEVVRHLKNPKGHTAPSQVLRTYRQSFDVAEFYADDGRQLSASAAAIVQENVMLIGTVADRAMICYL